MDLIPGEHVSARSGVGADDLLVRKRSARRVIFKSPIRTNRGLTFETLARFYIGAVPRVFCSLLNLNGDLGELKFFEIA